MNIAYYFPELNEGQRKMLERYIIEREEAAVQRAKESNS